MPELLNENMEFTDAFREQLPDLLGDAYYKDPDTRSEPIKVFDDVKDIKGLLKMTVDSKRAASKGREAIDAEYAERMKGMVKIPGEGATEDEIKAYRAAMNIPETADKYKEVFTPPEGALDSDQAYYGKLAETLSEAALKAGVPPEAAKAIWTEATASMQEYADGIEADGKKLMEQDIEAQKTELGPKYEEYVSDIEKTISKVGTEKLMGEADRQKAYDAWMATNPNASEDMKALFKKELGQTAGQRLMQTLSMFGLLQYEDGKLKGGHPAVMKTFAELAPLINSGKSHIGPAGGGSGDSEWFTDYGEIGKDQPLVTG